MTRLKSGKEIYLKKKNQVAEIGLDFTTKQKQEIGKMKEFKTFFFVLVHPPLFLYFSLSLSLLLSLPLALSPSLFVSLHPEH